MYYMFPGLILLAFVGGLLVAAQGPIYARLTEGLGKDHLLAVFLAFTSAAAVSGTMAFLSGSFRGLTVSAFSELPGWVWFGGLFGAIHVLISMKAIPSLGATLFMIMVVSGNLIGAAVYDHVGAMGLPERPFSVPKAVGIGLIIIGVGIVARS